MSVCGFAVPGDIDSKTGGYIYDRSLIEALRAAGRDVRLIQTGGSYPHPDRGDETETLRLLRAIPAEGVLIVDGLIFGALDTALLARVSAPMIAMLHHPLGLEPGLEPARARALIDRERANLRLAAHIVVPSPHVARLLGAEFGIAPARITVAPPGFAHPLVRALPKDQPPLILSVGLVCARKGHDVLLDALARVADLEWQAAIVGVVQDEALARALHAQRAALGLGARLRFAGCVSDVELGALYARATVFALATRYEGYGMAFGEAMLNGLPIVSCAAGAVPDTVPAETGLLVPPDDARAFAEALRRLLSSQREYRARSDAARRAGAALPEWADTARVVGSVIDRVRAARSG